jgi:hypothetical protein
LNDASREPRARQRPGRTSRGKDREVGGKLQEEGTALSALSLYRSGPRNLWHGPGNRAIFKHCVELDAGDRRAAQMLEMLTNFLGV